MCSRRQHHCIPCRRLRNLWERRFIRLLSVEAREEEREEEGEEEVECLHMIEERHKQTDVVLTAENTVTGRSMMRQHRAKAWLILQLQQLLLLLLLRRRRHKLVEEKRSNEGKAASAGDEAAREKEASNNINNNINVTRNNNRSNLIRQHLPVHRKSLQPKLLQLCPQHRCLLLPPLRAMPSKLRSAAARRCVASPATTTGSDPSMRMK